MELNYNPFSLEGKTILITGASSGIGKATAIECSKMGAKVILTGRDEQRLQETYHQLSGIGHLYFSKDISNYEGIIQLVELLPQINGLLNNAGITITKPISYISQKDLDELMSINLLTPIQLVNLLVKKKKLLKGGSVVFTSSIAKNMVSPGNSMYAASKGGLSAFMKGAAVELAAKSIRCNAILPGMVETDILKKRGTVNEEQLNINRQLYPLKRFGDSRDIALLAVYLFSDASSFMTGTELVIDGGRMLK